MNPPVETDPEFPCRRLPDDAAAARLIGLYPQRQDGLWMQRVKVLGGALTGPQWRALAEIARCHTPTEPLHLTTRQDVEVHGLSAEVVPTVQAALAGAGMSGLGACGDTPRNVTVCPSSGVRSGAPDLHPLAGDVQDELRRTLGVWSLPRKFKISLSACERGCAQPWINDLGFIATRRDGRLGFRVVGAGSLGAKPGTGIELYDWLDPSDVLPLVLAAVEFFAAHGDRSNRARARLRHVRERMGDAAFLERLRAAFDRRRGQADWPEVDLPVPADGLPDRVVLTFPNGDVTPDAAAALGALAEMPSTAVRIGNHHRVHVFGREPAMSASVARFAELRTAAAAQPSVVACPGTRWCSRGLADTNAAADRLRVELAAAIPAEATVCVSGCPNGCAQHAVAEVGLSGRRTKTDAGIEEVFDVTVGGGMGRDGRLGHVVATKVPPDQLSQTIREAMSK